MKIIKYLFYITTGVLSLSSCGEDRSGEYYARIEEDRWIEEKMKDIYLWYHDIPETELDYFAIPKDFFPTLLSKKAQEMKGDKYSYIETAENSTATRYINQESSYGFDFILYKDPFGKTNNNYARVLFVLPNSPASEAGLKRGDWISGVNNEVLTNDNYGYLYRGEQRRFATARIGINTDETRYWINTDTLTLPASRPVEDNPFYVDTIYQEGSKRIAYLMYNRFATGPGNTENETVYNDQMIRVLSQFQSTGFDELILDFRYNTGGYLSCSQLMASILAPSDALGKAFCKLIYNNKHASDNYELPFSTQPSGGLNLNLKRMYVIVSNLTTFAPEVLINSLTPFMGTDNIILVGTKTNGQNVALQKITTPYNFTLFPVVANVNNAEDYGNFYNGLSPSKEHTLDETQFYDSLYALGNTKEKMLYNTIELIKTGTMPDVKLDKPSTQPQLIPLFNSIQLRKKKGTLLPSYK